MRSFLLWLVSFVVIAGVAGGHSVHLLLYAVGIPAWAGIVLRELRR